MGDFDKTLEDGPGIGASARPANIDAARSPGMGEPFRDSRMGVVGSILLVANRQSGTDR